MNYSFPLVDFENTAFPMIMVSFMSRSGNRVGGAFVIDTASQHNILNEEISCVLADECFKTSGRLRLTSFMGKSISGSEVLLGFDAEGSHFDEVFYMAEGLDFSMMSKERTILGILGVDFLIKYGLALDFGKNTLHSSSIESVDIDAEKFDFLFPQEFGFRKYRLPVVGMTKGSNEYICLVDSGSNVNVITHYVLGEGDFKYFCAGESTSLMCVGANLKTDTIKAEFDLLSIGEKKGSVELKNNTAEFQVLSDDRYLVEGNSDIPPISVILGSGFLREQKWVIDFAYSLVYKMK